MSSPLEILVDQNITPRLIPVLANLGVVARHVSELGLEGASDPEVMETARTRRSIILTADSDFGKMLARSHAREPSVILLRHAQPYDLEPIAGQIAVVMENLRSRLAEGCLLTLDTNSVRARDLPI